MIKNYLEKNANTILGTDLQIKSISKKSWRKVTLSDIRIGDVNKSVILIKSIDIIINPFIKNNYPPFVSKITIDSPTIILRADPKGKLYMPLQLKPTVASKKIYPKIEIINGKIKVINLRNNILNYLKIENVTITTKTKDFSNLRITLSLIQKNNLSNKSISNNYKNKITIRGKYFSSLSQINLNIISDSFSINELSKFIKFKNSQLTKISGNCYLNSHLTYNFKLKPSIDNIKFNGKVVFSNINIQYGKYEVKKVFSKIFFDNKSAKFAIYTTSDLIFKVRGSINDFSSPELKADGTISNLNLSKITTGLPIKISGNLSSEFKIFKDSNNTQIDVRLSSSKTSFENTFFNYLDGFIFYKNGFIEIKNLRGFSKDGYLKVAGVIDSNNIKDLSYIFSAKFNNFKISKELIKKINVPDFIKFSSLNGNILLSKNSKNILGFGNFEINKLNFKNLLFEESNISFSIDEKGSVIKYIGFGDNYIAYCNGKIEKNKFLNLDLGLTNLPVHFIENLLNIKDISGNLNFNGKISGQINNPIILGKLDSTKLNFSGTKIKFLSSNIAYKEKTLSLNPITFSTSENTQTISFNYDFTTKNIDSTFTLKEFPLESVYRNNTFNTLIKVNNNEIEGGFLTGKIYFLRNFGNHELKGNIHVKNLKIYKNPIKWFESNFEYNKFLISKGTINLGEVGEIKYKGSFSNEDGLKFTYNSDRLELSRYFSEKYNKYLALPVQISGEINGTPNEPKIFTKINSSSIKINKCKFEKLNGLVEYKNHYLSFENFNLLKGNETFNINGNYDLVTSSLNISIFLKNLSLQSLSSMHFNNVFKNSQGNIEGEVTLWGPINHLNGTISILGSDLKLESYPLERLVFNASLDDNIIRISELSTYNQSTTFEVSGDFSTIKGLTNLNVNIRNAELQILNDFKKDLPQISGFIDANIQVYKDELAERIIGTSTLSDFSIQNVAFEKSRIELEVIKDKIFIKGKFLKGKERIELESIITTSGEKVYDLTEGELTLKSDKLNVSILNPILEKYKINVSGESEFDVHLKNIFHNLSISKKSKIKLKNVTINSEISNLPISNLYGEIFSSKDETLIIEHLTGSIGEKNFNISGWSKFNKFTFSKYNINLTGKSIPIHYKDFLKANANIDLTIEEKDNKTLVRGNIYFLKSEFIIPQLKKEGKYSFPASLRNWEQDITAVLREDFKVKNSNEDLVAYPYGSLNLRGTIENPEIVGTLKCEKGYFTLYDSLFTLTKEAELKFEKVEKRLVPNISVFAETKSKTFIDNKLTDLTIFIYIHGKIDGKAESLKMELSSSPPIAGGENEIFKILTHGYRIDELLAGKDLKDVLFEEASSLVTLVGIKPLRKKILEKIDIQNFEMRIDPNKNIIIEIDKKLTDKLFFNWFHIFSKEEEENEFELKYKFREKSYLKWKVDKLNNNTFEIEYLFEF